MDTGQLARVSRNCSQKRTPASSGAPSPEAVGLLPSASPGSSTTSSRRQSGEQHVETARATLVPVIASTDAVENGEKRRLTVTRRGFGPLRLPRGDMWLFHFAVDDEWQDYYVLAATPGLTTTEQPIFPVSEPLVLRVDSGCLTGQVFLDETCECRQQLHRAIELIQERHGLVIAIPGQDGRGLGLDAKLSMLHLDRAGFDTVEAARAIADDGQLDRRTYAGGVSVLKTLGVLPPRAIQLLTNNPLKIRAFRENGYIVEPTPLRIAATKYTERHLEAKRTQLGHLL